MHITGIIRIHVLATSLLFLGIDAVLSQTREIDVADLLEGSAAVI